MRQGCEVTVGRQSQNTDGKQSPEQRLAPVSLPGLSERFVGGLHPSS
jgi:hypothetical protein